jgi:hypothetical protein
VSPVPTQYFLSCYLNPPGDDSVLIPRHDQNVALWRRTPHRVELVRLWEFERHSGQKHHYWPLFSAPRAEEFLNALLAEEGLTLADVEAVWGTPGLPSTVEICWPAGSEAFPAHSLGHLFSGLLMDTEIFKHGTIVGVAVDGGPDFMMDSRGKRYWYAGCVARRGRVTFAPVESPAPLYAAGKALFGSEPGTLMALASASTTEIEFDVHEAVERLRLYGGRIQPLTVAIPFVQSVVDEAKRQLEGTSLDRRFTPDEHLQSAVMKVVQRACELIMMRNLDRLCELDGGVDPTDAYLSVSGGFALNCPANSALLDRFGFKGLLTPPCANDSGQSLGIGLLGMLGSGSFDGRKFRLGTPYYGSANLRVEEALAEFTDFVEDVSDFSPNQFVVDVTDAPLAWVDGASEIGPRALGHRSLLGDPRTHKTKDLLNEYKQRQWWRPVAPIVLAEYANEWFDRERPSPYMLETADVRIGVRSTIPAILHLDNSARHQTLTRATNERLYAAIDAFRRETGVPVLCNTSLNDKGEPIVNTAAEALNFCVRKGIQIAYVEGTRFALRIDPGAAPHGPRRRAVDHFAGQEAERDAIWQRWLDRGLTPSGLFLLTRSPDLRHGIAAGRTTARRVNELAGYLASNDPAFTLGAERYADMYGAGAVFQEGQAPLPARWMGLGD